MSNWLTPLEVEELTGYKRRKRQRRALSDMCIPHFVRESDGRPLVSRETAWVGQSPAIATFTGTIRLEVSE